MDHGRIPLISVCRTRLKTELELTMNGEGLARLKLSKTLK
jgi:hypothetical protein